MNRSRTSLEVIAPSVEEAIRKGLSELGLPREAVQIDVLDEGSHGLFGLGGRQARIRLSILAPEEVETAPSQPPAREAPEVEAPTPPATELSAEDELSLRVAIDAVSELLALMKVKAAVTAHMGEAEEARNRRPIMLEVHGNDLSILIGRHAETLNALQYISYLIIGKELGRSIPVIIDVEGYRSRRERQLRQLARRMADQAVKTGRRQVLEPMPANERRVIHLELRDHPQVKTESIGDDPRRKVTIIPQ
ncbi:MAG: protein jag [Anaerolineales bacterium]|nr:protein jag [Anaerolineales bacterium]